MVQIQISLPEAASDFIQQQIAAGRYRSADEFVGELVDQARAMAADDRVAELIREGMESGDGEEVNDEWWDRIDAKVREEIQRRQSV
jgi:antitoxin ParD1/3/4